MTKKEEQLLNFLIRYMMCMQYVDWNGQWFYPMVEFSAEVYEGKYNSNKDKIVRWRSGILYTLQTNQFSKLGCGVENKNWLFFRDNTLYDLAKRFDGSLESVVLFIDDFNCFGHFSFRNIAKYSLSPYTTKDLQFCSGLRRISTNYLVGGI